MLRSALLSLSEQSWLRQWTEQSRTAERVTKRFVAGRTLEEELSVCRHLNQEGILTTVDYLGENVTSIAAAEVSRDAYLGALHQIHNHNLSATVSIKPSQFGLEISNEACHSNLEVLSALAKEYGTRIEIDMESSDYVDRTLELVSRLHARYGSVRAVIQAYLYRSEADIRTLCAQGIPIRLCKGAYREPADRAFPKKSQVDANYVHLMKILIDDGVQPAIASHDPQMIEQTLAYIRERKLPADRFEFQMLYGIRRDLQRQLAKEYRLRLYVPFGDAWYPYFMRRLAERPANVLFLARNLLRQ